LVSSRAHDEVGADRSHTVRIPGGNLPPRLDENKQPGPVRQILDRHLGAGANLTAAERADLQTIRVEFEREISISRKNVARLQSYGYPVGPAKLQRIIR
jgi:hypothetical protein